MRRRRELHLRPAGRAILGSAQEENEKGKSPYGGDWSKPVAGARRRWPPSGQCGIEWRNCVNRDFTVLPLRNALFDLPPYKGQVARDLDRRARPAHAEAPTIRGRILSRLRAQPQSTRDGWKRFERRHPTRDATPMAIVPAMWLSGAIAEFATGPGDVTSCSGGVRKAWPGRGSSLKVHRGLKKLERSPIWGAMAIDAIRRVANTRFMRDRFVVLGTRASQASTWWIRPVRGVHRRDAYWRARDASRGLLGRRRLAERRTRTTGTCVIALVAETAARPREIHRPRWSCPAAAGCDAVLHNRATIRWMYRSRPSQTSSRSFVCHRFVHRRAGRLLDGCVRPRTGVRQTDGCKPSLRCTVDPSRFRPQLGQGSGRPLVSPRA